METTGGSDKDQNKNTKIEQPREVIALHRLTNDARAQRSHSSKGKGDQLSQDIMIKIYNCFTCYHYWVLSISLFQTLHVEIIKAIVNYGDIS
jgi:hypothetical protein